MKETSANMNKEERKYYLSEFSLDDGEYDITLNIIDVNFFVEVITLAITRAGRIIQDSSPPLLRDKDGKLYFEFGRFYEKKIMLDDFQKIGEYDD